MKMIIFGSTLDRAIKKMNSIINYCNKIGKEVKETIKTSNEYRVIFKNGDIIRAIQGNENIHGLRANVGLIDKAIPKAVREQIIKPCISAFPWNAIGYYNIEEKKD